MRRSFDAINREQKKITDLCCFFKQRIISLCRKNDKPNKINGKTMMDIKERDSRSDIKDWLSFLKDAAIACDIFSASSFCFEEGMEVEKGVTLNTIPKQNSNSNKTKTSNFLKTIAEDIGFEEIRS